MYCTYFWGLASLMRLCPCQGKNCIYFILLPPGLWHVPDTIYSLNKYLLNKHTKKRSLGRRRKIKDSYFCAVAMLTQTLWKIYRLTYMTTFISPGAILRLSFNTMSYHPTGLQKRIVHIGFKLIFRHECAFFFPLKNFLWFFTFLNAFLT